LFLLALVKELSTNYQADLFEHFDGTGLKMQRDSSRELEGQPVGASGKVVQKSSCSVSHGRLKAFFVEKVYSGQANGQGNTSWSISIVTINLAQMSVRTRFSRTVDTLELLAAIHRHMAVRTQLGGTPLATLKAANGILNRGHNGLSKLLIKVPVKAAGHGGAPLRVLLARYCTGTKTSQVQGIPLRYRYGAANSFSWSQSSKCDG